MGGKERLMLTISGTLITMVLRQHTGIILVHGRTGLSSRHRRAVTTGWRTLSTRAWLRSTPIPQATKCSGMSGTLEQKEMVLQTMHQLSTRPYLVAVVAPLARVRRPQRRQRLFTSLPEPTM